jgi:hypothetical protein
MTLAGQTAGGVRRRLPWLAGCALSLLPLAVLAQDGLVGLWDIEVQGGTAEGDHGQITISGTAEGLVGDLVYVDVSYGATATQTCRVWKGDTTISIYCRVVSVAPTDKAHDYFPDNFFVRQVASDRMEGQTVSATSGNATLTRGEQPTS